MVSISVPGSVVTAVITGLDGLPSGVDTHYSKTTEWSVYNYIICTVALFTVKNKIALLLLMKYAIIYPIMFHSMS